MITAPNVDFGSAPTVDTFAPVTGQIALSCTKGMTYTVGLTAGSHTAANGRRQMASGGNYLQYDIFSAGSQTVWGDTNNRVSSQRAADGVTNQQFPYTARIYTDQITPPVGTYADTVQIDVRY
jgi:spore coat protein U-like protein